MATSEQPQNINNASLIFNIFNNTTYTSVVGYHYTCLKPSKVRAECYLLQSLGKIMKLKLGLRGLMLHLNEERW